VIGIPTATKMGLAAAATVAVAALVAITLVPSLLGFFPRAVLARAVRRTGAMRELHDRKENMGSRWARFVLRYPLPVLLLAVSALGVIAVPAFHLRLGEAGMQSCLPQTPSGAPMTTSVGRSVPGSTVNSPSS
jgi:RND superfamily putative drug exporter